MKIKIKKGKNTEKKKVSLNALGTVLHRVYMGWLHFNQDTPILVVLISPRKPFKTKNEFLNSLPCLNLFFRLYLQRDDFLPC